VWIGLLGPLCVGQENKLHYVPAAKQRTLLAALAVRAGDVLPTDALAEVIWDGFPPASWHTTLRNYIKRLRFILGDDIGARILTRSPGYLLQATPDEVDLLSFQRRYQDGRAAARAGHWEQASAILSQAVGLWRGTPFADIPSRQIRDVHVPYLEEMRLAALELRIDADLRISPSRAVDVVPELQKLCQERPESERLTALLMLALYRCGRPGDALAVYRRARQVSIGELAMEPGPELQAMHQRILAADNSLHLKPTTTGSTAADVAPALR
jgi:DNA-binding SARP family transcriptional activator